MALRYALMLAALHAALTAPALGRHRRPRWPVRAATTARERARYALGVPDPADRHRPAHAARRHPARTGEPAPA